MRAGPQDGLRLQLDIGYDAYLDSSSVGGVKVVIHQDGTAPFPEDGGIIAAPGSYTNIGIREVPLSYSFCACNGLTDVAFSPLPPPPHTHTNTFFGERAEGRKILDSHCKIFTASESITDPSGSIATSYIGSDSTIRPGWSKNRTLYFL